MSDEDWIIFKNIAQRLRFRDTRKLNNKNLDELTRRREQINIELIQLEEKIEELEYERKHLNWEIYMKQWLDDLDYYIDEGYDLNKLLKIDGDYSLQPGKLNQLNTKEE